MKDIKLSLEILALISLWVLINSYDYDYSTQSNFEDIRIKHLSGEFKIDFENKLVNGSLIYDLIPLVDRPQMVLDTKKLNIINIYKINTTNGTLEPLNFFLGDEDPILGTPLFIDFDYSKDDVVQIKIEYKTTSEGISAQFLSPEQTLGKKYPYFFTQSKMILGRSLFPCQDVPAVKFTFNLKIIVPKDLRGMISGIYEGVSNYTDKNYKVYSYKQENPIHSYLLSLAAGNIEEQAINDNITLYTEPEYIDKAYNEIYEDLPKAFDLAINYTGPFRWDKFNLLVLPRSFPYSGVENPNLVFLSPCIISDDKSLIDIIIQTLMHHWAGNLVTNEHWSDFWINGGIALFLRRKIMGLLKNDTELARMDGYVGMFYIKFWIDYFGEENKELTKLKPTPKDENPEDYFTNIPYEKGYNFIYFIEHLIGKENMEQFFKSYFEDLKYHSIPLTEFQNYFTSFCNYKSISRDILDQINWVEWLNTEGDIPKRVEEKNQYKEQAEEIIEKNSKYL